VISAGDEVRLAERPNPDFAFPRLVTIVNLGGATLAEMRAMAAMPGIASRIAAKARAALAN
jgi:MOSC domain-containing protein YiiM